MKSCKILRMVSEQTNSTPIHDFEPNKDLLPPTELALPVYFAGKVFINSKEGATDHLGHPQLINYYNKRIYFSEWANDHIHGNLPQNIHLRASRFSEPQYRIFGTQGNANLFSTYNVEWHRDDDFNVERGKEVHSDRNFASTEKRDIEGPKAIELLSKGYGLWSKLASIPNLNWVNNAPHNTNNRLLSVSGFKDPATEVINFEEADSLWNNRKWLDEDALVAALADTYRAISTGKHVIMPKTSYMQFQDIVKIGEAISQMVAAKNNQLIGWVTDRGILGFTDRKAHHLTFTDESRPELLQFDDIVVNPLNSRVNEHNSDLVHKIRQIFINPVRIALKQWRDVSLV